MLALLAKLYSSTAEYFTEAFACYNIYISLCIYWKENNTLVYIHIIDFNPYPATVSFALKMLSALYVKIGCTYLSALTTRFLMEANNIDPDQTALEQSDLGAYCFAIKAALEHKQTRVADDKSCDWRTKY